MGRYYDRLAEVAKLSYDDSSEEADRPLASADDGERW